jgi:hypothetical protein
MMIQPKSGCGLRAPNRIIQIHEKGVVDVSGLQFASKGLKVANPCRNLLVNCDWIRNVYH